MSTDILRRLREQTGLAAREVIAPDIPADELADLCRELVRFFPDHAHVCGELALAWSGGWVDPEVVVHAWLLTLDDRPVGFTVFHTSLRRQVVLQHFVGLEPDARADLPPRWVLALADAVLDTGRRDCAERGLDVLATMGENMPEHTRAWERFGYVTLDVDYREPRHGRHWREFGPPAFFPMTPQIRLTEAGRARSFPEVVDAGLCAFLLDHYLLPEDEPTVVRARELGRISTDPSR